MSCRNEAYFCPALFLFIALKDNATAMGFKAINRDKNKSHFGNECCLAFMYGDSWNITTNSNEISCT